MFRRRKSFPPRPRRRGLAEASLDWHIQAAVAAMGAKRAVGPRQRNRIKLSGVPREDLEVILERVRGVADWSREWMRYAEIQEAAGDYEKAAAAAYLGQLLISIHHPTKQWFIQTMQRCHRLARNQRTDLCVERVELGEGKLVGLWETPREVLLPPVLMLAPLACHKEELTPLADPLLEQGHPVLRLDLPGQGESPHPLRPDSELLLLDAVNEMRWSRFFVGGISLGSFYALRLAATAPERVCGVFAVSPPAILNEQEWANQLEIIWQYLDYYFDTETRQETHELAMQLNLEDCADRVGCPVILYHATKDRINSPRAREIYRDLLPSADLTDFLLPDAHACPYHLRPRIGPEISRWAQRIAEPTMEPATEPSVGRTEGLGQKLVQIGGNG
ncbi:MAG: hypothetical protein OHK0029_09020 [Armatimonadaceae bacterium]